MAQIVWDSRRLSTGGSLSSLASSCGSPRRLDDYEEDDAITNRGIQVIDDKAISWDAGRERIQCAELIGIHFLRISIALSSLQPQRKLGASVDTKDALKRTLNAVKEFQVPPSVASHCLLTAVSHGASDKELPIIRQVLLQFAMSPNPDASKDNGVLQLLLARRDAILQRKLIFLLCNPFGGRKKAALIFHEIVEPLFHLAEQAFEYRGGLRIFEHHIKSI